MEHLVWQIDPVLLNLGILKIRWYGLMFASAFIFCFTFMQWIYKNEGKPVEELDNLLWYAAIGTVVGARLGHTLLYDPGYYLSNPLKILSIWEGGLASHGGILGILLALYFYKRSSGDSYVWLLDRVAVPCAMGGFFIRMGNFFNSEILGTETDLPWGIIFASADPLPRHPVQLYEAFSYAGIFFILWWVYKKTWDKPIKGLLFGLSVILVFTVRIIAEFFKTEQAAYDTGIPFTTGQLLSVPFLLVGIAFVVWAVRNYRRLGV